MSNHKYLNLEGLSLYTEHVKQYIDNGDSEFLTCTWDDNLSGTFVLVYGKNELNTPIQGGTILDGILMATPSIDGESPRYENVFLYKRRHSCPLYI